MTLLQPKAEGNRVQWSAPPGKWVITQFYLQPSRGFDGGTVDLLNPDAMKLYFQLTYGEYHRRFQPFFKNTIHYSFSDHEGDYGYRIAWTPRLFSAFQQNSGYDLRKVLPLLIYDGGDLTPKVRNDYLATITKLYKSSFWDGITQQAAQQGLRRTGHAWEESLQWAAALEGNLFAAERGLNPVGVDSLEDFGRQPLNFKVAQSVADYEERRFMCENQGVQGTNSYLDMEGIRRGTNPIGAWGVNLFVPHAFNYDASRANYPPDWFHQLYWPYFHYYADYTRRISYMNSDSRHVANVLLYYPITTMWAHTRPLFSGETNYENIGKPADWKNVTVMINDYYTRITLQLAQHQWDFNVADDLYFAQSHVEGNQLVIGSQRFRAVILPPLTTLSRKTLAKLQEFYRAGGTVLAIRQLPTSSSEDGDNDQALHSGLASLFGAGEVENQLGYIEKDSPAGGHTYYVTENIDKLIDLLDAHVQKDVRVLSGPSDHLYLEHRQKMQTDYYWVVNDSDRARVNEVFFSHKGRVEKWNALTGQREPLFYENQTSGTKVRLDFSPWDAYYVVFHSTRESAQDAELISTNADRIDTVSHNGNSFRVHVTGSSPSGTHASLRFAGETYTGRTPPVNASAIALNGDWQFRPQPDQVPVPYAKVMDTLAGEGEQRGWAAPAFDDDNWPSIWLSEAQNMIRNWSVIGPFSNPNNSGYDQAYPPEEAFDLQKKYLGVNNQMVSWKSYDSNEPRLALQDWGIWMKTTGGEFSDAAQVVQFDPELFTKDQTWIISYAHTYLYSPRPVKAQLYLAVDNWARVWLDHKLVYQRLRQPYWYELNDNWADRIPVDLHAGWNEVLLKAGKARGTASGFYGFTFRVADENGKTLPDVIASLTPHPAGNALAEEQVMRWYRMQVPPGCTAVKPPSFRGPFRMWMNGEELHFHGSAPVPIHKPFTREKNILVIAASKTDRLDAPVEFITGATPFSLQPWTRTGLANFSGTAVYTKTFTAPQIPEGQHWMLDLGRVSSVADVSLNGHHAGTLIWRPYRLDVTNLLKPGTNEIKITVTDTEANARAVGTSRHILNAIDVCGLEGPVQILPYADQAVILSRKPDEGPLSKNTY